MVAAEEFVLIPKHVYVREQPHAAHVLLDNSIEHKKPQLSYLNRMRPQLPPKQSDASTDTIPIPVTVAPEDHRQPTTTTTTLMTEDEGDGTNVGSDESTDAMDAVERRILGQLEIMDVKKLTRAKNVLEIIKSSTRVKINKNDEMIYLDKVPTGIKASVFLYDIQQQNKKLQNPAFIMILSALNLNEQSVMNTYAKHAIKSAIATTAKIKIPTKQPTSVDSTNSPSSSSKTVKKRSGNKSTSLQQTGKKKLSRRL